MIHTTEFTLLATQLLLAEGVDVAWDGTAG